MYFFTKAPKNVLITYRTDVSIYKKNMGKNDFTVYCWCPSCQKNSVFNKKNVYCLFLKYGHL